MADRRFDDDEVAHILAAASIESARGAIDGPDVSPRASGLSLSELQAVGAEVGITAEAIARAAERVRRGELVATQRRIVAGLPVAVSRTIHFARPVSELEWDRIVVALRETFEARGVVERQGSVREWRNGHLRAVLERTENGDQLRLATRRGDAGFFVRTGASLLTLSVVLGGMSAFSNAAEARNLVVPSVLLGLLGVAALARNVLVLPVWARQRAAQMESLGPAIDRVLGSGVAG